MGGGTFFKVWGGTGAHQTNYTNFLWFEWAFVTSQTWNITSLPIYTIWRSKLHYFRL